MKYANNSKEESKMDEKKCMCGCGEIITSISPDGRKKDFRWGHNSRGHKNEWSMRPDSTNSRTGRWRGRKLIDTTKCILGYTGECHGRMEVHHIDKNAVNNSPENIVPTCKTHHSFLDRGRITFNNPKLPEYYIDGSGKRRYKRHEFSVLREKKEKKP